MESIEKSCSSFKISQPSEVVNLICVAYDQKVTVAKWKNYVAHNMKEKKAFHEIDHILDSKMEPLVFDFSDGVDTDDSDDELVRTNERGLQRIKTSFREKTALFRATILKKKKHIFTSRAETKKEITSDRYWSWVVYFHSMICAFF